MHDDSTADSIATPDLPLLIDSLPPAFLLKYLKGRPEQFKIIFHGFAPRDRALTIPIVRQRLLAEAEKTPDMVDELRALWGKHYNKLLTQLLDDDFSPSPERRRTLLKKHGDAALRYALQTLQREDWLQFIDNAPASDAPPPPAPKQAPHPQQHAHTALHQQIGALQATIATLTLERDQARKTQSEAEKQLAAEKKNSAELTKRLTEHDRKWERDIRRTKKLEDELAKSEKLRRAQLAQSAMPTTADTSANNAIPAPQLIALLREALTLLESQTTVGQQLVSPCDLPATPAVTLARPKTAAAKTPVPPAEIVLPGTRGERRYQPQKVVAALRGNDEKMLHALRDGIARLDGQAAKKQEVFAALARVGIPNVLLIAPLRPAVIDGSNIARLNSGGKRGKVDYILQTQQSAWCEGYFPVIIIIDASLPHQIDNPSRLTELIDCGIIRMVEAGTSADVAIIAESEQRHALIITNDRMSDWPEASNLDKRQVSLNNNRAVLGDMHRSTDIFFR